jgi:excisionase family DNA binding protein
MAALRSLASKESGGKRAVRQPLLSVREVAELLQVPVRTIYDWRYRGLGPPAIRIGRHVRYEPNEVDRWLASQKGSSWEPGSYLTRYVLMHVGWFYRGWEGNRTSCRRGRPRSLEKRSRIIA